jgi:hypothetical protein
VKGCEILVSAWDQSDGRVGTEGVGDARKKVGAIILGNHTPESVVKLKMRIRSAGGGKGAWNRNCSHEGNIAREGESLLTR